VQDVEGEEDCRQALLGVGYLPFQLQRRSVLQPIERWLTVLEDNNFAIEDQWLQWLRGAIPLGERANRDLVLQERARLGAATAAQRELLALGNSETVDSK
jgi:hypothetical protein